MKLTSIHFRLLVAALCASAATVCYAGGADAKADQKAASSQAKKASAAGSELQRLLNELRDNQINVSEKLARDLKTATEAQRKEIIAKMEANRKAFEEASSAFMKQINDERRKQRAGASKR